MNPLMMAMQGAVQRPQGNNFMTQAIQAYRSGKIVQFAQKQMQENPQFRQFVEQNKGKYPMQVALENGVDLTRFMK